MLRSSGLLALGGVSFAALALLLAPAGAAPNQKAKARPRAAPSFLTGSFTPAVADPRLAAEFARRGIQSSGFRFTPSAATGDKSKAIRVAVRAKSGTTAAPARSLADAGTSAPVTAITPTAYNLGVSVGWKRFAISGDVAKVQGGPVPGGREAAELDLSYSLKKFTGSIQLGAERAEGVVPRIIPEEKSYSVGVGGSYRITRNLDVTGGVRYRIQSDRLEALSDDKRDSQAVYIGTAFRF